MKIYVKYFILLFALSAGGQSVVANNIGSGIAAAGAFICYALIEIQDLKIDNNQDN